MSKKKTFGVSVQEGRQLALEGKGLAKIEASLLKLADADFGPLMTVWEDILQEDNRRGVLQGIGGDSKPLEPVTYRPKPVKSVDLTILPNNNLTPSHYRTLGGQPLAPRGVESRVIANFRTASARLPSGNWAVVGAWEGIADPQGRPFIGHHFEGRGHLPKRDLRGVRLQAQAEATAALREFLQGFLTTFPSSS